MNCWFDDVADEEYFGIALGSKGKIGMNIIPLC